MRSLVCPDISIHVVGVPSLAAVSLSSYLPSAAMPEHDSKPTLDTPTMHPTLATSQYAGTRFERQSSCLCRVRNPLHSHTSDCVQLDSPLHFVVRYSLLSCAFALSRFYSCFAKPTWWTGTTGRLYLHSLYRTTLPS